MLTSHAESDRHMEHVIGKGYRLEELLDFSRGGMGEGAAFRNPRRFLNKRNLRRVGGIMRNANLTQSFSFYLPGFSPACPYMFPIPGDPRGPLGPCAFLLTWAELAGGGSGVSRTPEPSPAHPPPCPWGPERERAGSPEPCLCPSVGRQTADTAKISG